MRQVQKEEGIAVKTLEDEPTLYRHLHWVWKAFTDLSYRRVVGMGGALPITYSDIHAYCSLKGIYSLIERERLVNFIDLLDRHWMTKHYEKVKASAASEPAPKPPTKPNPARRPPRKPVS